MTQRILIILSFCGRIRWKENSVDCIMFGTEFSVILTFLCGKLFSYRKQSSA
ncbi:hypothetical protein J4461_00305 [Candidatus Pacearchaeota archaeon]|nr:hypothetical protein [Candidatus Pacearchaeota archaeon]